MACNTKDQERGNAFLFFGLHHVKIEKSGYGDGVIINRNFLGKWYKYRISTSGGEIKLQVREIYEVGQSVRFSVKGMKILFR